MSVDLRLVVLKVLGGQSPGYFIFPNASAFVAEGLDPDDVARELAELHRDGRLERELLDVGEDDEQVPGGYRLVPDNGNPTKEDT